jgi:hypothetical protein
VQALQKHAGITWELDRLEKAANREIRKTLPQFRYDGKVTEALLGDLAAVVANNDWRPALEQTAERLRRAAKHIRAAVLLMVQAAKGSSTYAMIPPIVFKCTAEAQAERHRVAVLPAADRLFGSGGAVKAFIDREKRTVVDPRKIRPDLLKAMLVLAAECEPEAERIAGILKTRIRRYDSLGPKLMLLSDVKRFTGKPHDAAVARLLTEAYQIAGKKKQFSTDSIRKLREHHSPSKP